MIQTIQKIRQKLPVLRARGLKETPTRTLIIDPLLEALGWDIHDPDEVELEYPTVDGKSVDYALKLNKNPVILVEAKALDASLEEVKSITQIVGYAANNGIVWCILTNGVLWRVYRSVEKCPAPEKLMFEVNLDPDLPGALSAEEIARQMWRFSRDEVAKGTLDALGEQTFTDGKVRKAIEALMLNPPNKFLKLLRDTSDDDTLSLPRIKASLGRLVKQLSSSTRPAAEIAPVGAAVPEPVPPPSGKPRKRAKKAESVVDEAHHLSGKPAETVALYRQLEQYCLKLEPSAVTRRWLAKSINFDYADRCFCSAPVVRNDLRIWVKLRYRDIPNPPRFARDVSQIGHWGVGDTELRITTRTELEEAKKLIQQAFLAVKNKAKG